MRARRGATLIELVVVIALMAIVAGVAAPALRSAALGANQPAANRVAMLLSSVRSRAIAKGVTVTLTIDPATGRFWADSPDTSGVITLADGASMTGAERVHFRFLPNGQASAEPLVVTEAGDARLVRVDPWSGEVSVHAR